jgi:hypothetical protein
LLRLFQTYFKSWKYIFNHDWEDSFESCPEDYTPASFGHCQGLDVQEVKKKKKEVKTC